MKMEELVKVIEVNEFARRESWPPEHRVKYIGSALFWDKQTEMWGLRENIFQASADVPLQPLDAKADDWVIVRGQWRQTIG